MTSLRASSAGSVRCQPPAVGRDDGGARLGSSAPSRAGARRCSCATAHDAATGSAGAGEERASSGGTMSSCASRARSGPPPRIRAPRRGAGASPLASRNLSSNTKSWRPQQISKMGTARNCSSLLRHRCTSGPAAVTRAERYVLDEALHGDAVGPAVVGRKIRLLHQLGQAARALQHSALAPREKALKPRTRHREERQRAHDCDLPGQLRPQAARSPRC
jgi:hypothetical protein